jgi:hypothetical protein
MARILKDMGKINNQAGNLTSYRSVEEFSVSALSGTGEDTNS